MWCDAHEVRSTVGRRVEVVYRKPQETRPKVASQVDGCRNTIGRVSAVINTLQLMVQNSQCQVKQEPTKLVSRGTANTHEQNAVLCKNTLPGQTYDVGPGSGGRGGHKGQGQGRLDLNHPRWMMTVKLRRTLRSTDTEYGERPTFQSPHSHLTTSDPQSPKGPWSTSMITVLCSVSLSRPPYDPSTHWLSYTGSNYISLGPATTQPVSTPCSIQYPSAKKRRLT